MKRIKNDIENKTFARVYLLYGPESYLRLNYTKRLCDAIVPESDAMNRLDLEGDNVRESEIIDFAETIPFFAERRLVRIKDSGLMKTGAELLPDYMKSIPGHAVLVFCETEADKRSRLYKAIKNAGYISEFGEQNEETLMKWAAGLLGKSDLRISANNMKYLLSRTGRDMNHISLEIDKLANYCHGKTVVEKQDIDSIIGTQIENHIFDMIEAVTGGNQRRALDLYSDLLALKEPPMRILYLIARQYNQLLIIKELMAEGNSSALIAQKSGIHPFAVRKLSGIAGKFSSSDLKQAVSACVAMEEAVKTGQIGDRLSVELILLGAARAGT